MSADRKKITPKPVNKVEPKKRVEPKKIEKPKSVKKVEEKKRVDPKKVLKPTPKKREEVVKKPEQPKETEKPKAKRSEDKYIRIALDATSDERKIFSDRVAKGEIKLAYFAVENDKGYHYYLVIKK